MLRYVRNKIIKIKQKEKPLVPKLFEFKLPLLVFKFVQWDKVQDFDCYTGEKIKEVELKINQFNFVGNFEVLNQVIR